MVGGRDDLHDDLEGVKDDHGGLCGHDALDVGVGLGVDDPLRAGHLGGEAGEVGGVEGGLEEGVLVPSPTATSDAPAASSSAGNAFRIG